MYLELLAVERKPISPFNVGDLHTNTKYVEKAWKTWKASAVFKEMSIAKSYYNNDNVFMKDFKRKAIFTLNKEKTINTKGSTEYSNQEDLYKTEIKVTSPLFKDLVDQIAGFILNNEIKLETESTTLKKKMEELESKKSFRHLLKSQLKETMIKAYSGMNYLLDGDNEVTLQPVPAESFAFFYENTLSQKPIYAIITTEINNKYLEIVDDKEKWSSAKCNSYIVISQDRITKHSKDSITNEWIIDNLSFGTKVTRPMTVKEPDGTEVETFEVLEEKVMQLEALPFSIMTTSTLRSKLYDVKSIIDALDINTSDAMSELIRLIKNLWVLKGSDGASIDETMKLIEAGILNLDEEGDVKNIQGNEAIDPRMKMNEQLKESFYRFAKVVDLEKLKSLSNTSSIAIKALYEPLNQIAKDIETELAAYIIDILKKTMMLENEGSIAANEEEFKDVTVVFSHSMLSNENEDLTANALQVGKIPEEVRLAHHPWAKNMSEEEIKAYASKAKAENEIV